MTRIFLMALAVCCMPTLAWATANTFSDTPLCLTVKNDAGVEALVHTETPYFTDQTGQLRQYGQTFKLAADAVQEVCSTGPFFDNNAIRVVVRTSVPLYSCKVPLSIDRMVVTILRRPNSDDQNDLIMDCIPE